MTKPLTIGIDIRDLRVAKTGTKTYLEELCKEFKKMNNHELRFYFLDTDFRVYTGNKKIFKWIGQFRYQLWKQVILPVKAYSKNCDIVFCTDIFVPLIHLGYKTIPVFHDAFFFETPGNYGKLWLWLFKKTAVPAAKKSPFVITPTEYSKVQIHRFTQISKNQLVVVPEGPKTLIHHKNNETKNLLQSLSIKPPNYILHVGSMFKRKNIVALIQAFGKIKKKQYPDLKLVLAGPLPVNKLENDHELIINAIKSEHLQSDVIITGYLTDQEIGQLYDNALIYVFPSVNEGFGLPVLEAFEHDLPVLVADNTCLPEVGGNAVLTFNPFDVDDIAEKINIVLSDPNLQKEMIEKGRERLKDFSWQKTAFQLIEVFKKAVGKQV